MLTSGTRLGHYEVVSSLGAGGMGEVYRARDTTLQRDVAIKVLPDAFASDPERLARFEREAQVLAALNHPDIATIYGVERSATGGRALVMELVEGPTLAEVIEVGLLIMYLCFDVLNVIVLWVLYIALEPFVRRRWPQMLISWSRLLSGEWRDPLVGRDVLAGCAASVVLACLFSLYELVPRGLGYPGMPPPTFFLDSLHGTRTTMAQLSGVPGRRTTAHWSCGGGGMSAGKPCGISQLHIALVLAGQSGKSARFPSRINQFHPSLVLRPGSETRRPRSRTLISHRRTGFIFVLVF